MAASAAAPSGERIVRVHVRRADLPPRARAGSADIEGGIQRKDEVPPGEVGSDGLLSFACELCARRDVATGAPVFLGPFAVDPPAAASCT